MSERDTKYLVVEVLDCDITSFAPDIDPLAAIQAAMKGEQK